jgi:putative ABC transport system permease protein
MTFFGLVIHNVVVKPLRLALTSLAVAIGVTTVVSLGVVTQSLQTSALAILKTGQADFTIAQKGVSDIVSSSINEAVLPKIAAYPGVASVTGVLIAITKLNAANPLFLEIGIAPEDLAPFGVHVLTGRAFAPLAQNEVMLGWRASENLGIGVGGRIVLDHLPYRVVGIYSTGQALGDAGAMVPLVWLQAVQRQSGELTLLFVRVTQHTNVAALQARIDHDFPQLTTIRTIAQFGRADRSLALINAANDGSTVLAIVIGAIVVMSAMTMTFVERIREFGVLSAIGWPRRRIMGMILSEAGVIGLIGAVGGVGLSVLAVLAVSNLPALTGVLQPDYTPSVFGRALYTAAAMSLIGGLYPSLRAAVAAPLEALRHE